MSSDGSGSTVNDDDEESEEALRWLVAVYEYLGMTVGYQHEDENEDEEVEDESSRLLEELRREASDVLQSVKDLGEPVGDASVDERKSFDETRLAIDELLGGDEPARDTIDRAKQLRERLQQAIVDVNEAVRKRLAVEAREILRQLDELRDPLESVGQELDGVLSARELVRNALSGPTLNNDSILRARELLGAVSTAIDRAADVIRQRLKREAEDVVNRLRELGAPTSDASVDERRPFDDAKAGLEDLPSRDNLNRESIQRAREQLEVVRLAIETVNRAVRERWEEQSREVLRRLDEIKDPDDAEGTELDQIAATRRQIREAVDASQLSNASIERAGQLLEQLANQAREAADAIQRRLRKSADVILKRLAPKADLGGDPEGALPKQLKEIGRRRELIREPLSKPSLTAVIVREGGREADQLAEYLKQARTDIADLGGPRQLGQLTKALGGAEKLDQLATDFGLEGNAKGLKKLVDELGGGPKLAKLLKQFPESGKLPELCTQLGGAPIVTVMLDKAFGGNTAKLAEFQTEFSGETGKLTDLLDQGGLKAHPEALATLLVGSGGPAGLKKLCNQLKPTDLANLKTVITDGGLGGQPDVFGQLISIGCPNRPEGGEDWDIQKLCAKFATKPAALKSLLVEGGLSKKTSKPPVDEKCLAQLLAIGCDGNPDTLFALAESGKLPQLKGLLQTGTLGERPEIMGHLFKLGCDQDPNVLSDLHGQLSGTSKGVAQLGDLLDAGNLKQRPEMLGEILGKGCGKRANKFKDLAVAFSGTPTKLGQLKELADNWQDQAGEAILSLTDPQHLDGDFTKLQTQFTQTLANRGGSRTNRLKLIKAAPDFKRTPVTSAKNLNDGLVPPLGMPVGLEDFSTTDCDHLMAHVFQRHAPKGFAFRPTTDAFTPINFHNTQLPEDWEAQDVADLLQAALASVAGKNELARLKGIIDQWALRKKAYQDYQDYITYHPQWVAYRLYEAWANQWHKRWTAYQHNRQRWNGPIPPAPPNQQTWSPHPRYAWTENPPVIPPNTPDPGAPPQPQGAFTHDRVEFTIGIVREQGNCKITQFFPNSSTNPDIKLTEFSQRDMEVLRDAMIK